MTNLISLVKDIALFPLKNYTNKNKPKKKGLVMPIAVEAVSVQDYLAWVDAA